MNDPRPDEGLMGPTPAPRQVILTIGALGLLMPQSQVRTLEPGFDVERAQGEEVGWIDVAGGRWPVWCLSEDLRPIRGLPSRHICALLSSGTRLFGVLCDQVVMFEQQGGIDVLPVPECMRTPEMPVRALVAHGEQVLCATSAEDLLACMGAIDDPAQEADTRDLPQGRAP